MCLQSVLQILVDHPGFDRGGHGVGVDPEDAVHGTQRQQDRPGDRACSTGQPGTRPLRHHRDAVGVGETHGVHDVVDRGRPHQGEGRTLGAVHRFIGGEGRQDVRVGAQGAVQLGLQVVQVRGVRKVLLVRMCGR